MRPLGLAVWGLGPHAVRNLLPAVAEARGVALRGVHSRSGEAVADACARYGCGRWDGAEEMLADPAVEVVLLATPIGLHAAQGMAVLRAGKHLWCEKPLATRTGEAGALADASRGRGVSLAEGFMYLHHPQFARLRELVDSGELGRVESMACRFGIPPLERPGFRADPALGGGAFLDVGSYPASAACALFAGAEAEVAFAEIATAPGSCVDTSGRALLRLGGGASALLEWRTGVAYRNELDLWGSAGSVTAERVFSKPADHVARLRLRDRTGAETVEEVGAANHFVAMLEAFRGLAADSGAAERERETILRRARLLDRIRDRARGRH